MFKLIVLAIYLRSIEVDPYFLVITLRDFSFLNIKTPLFFFQDEITNRYVTTAHYLFRFKNISIYQPQNYVLDWSYFIGIMNWNLDHFIPFWIAVIYDCFCSRINHPELNTDICICCLSCYWFQILAFIDINCKLMTLSLNTRCK